MAPDTPRRPPSGEDHHRAKLTDREVAAILDRWRASGGRRGVKAALAREFRVSEAHVGRLIRGESRAGRGPEPGPAE
jgi:hypothetical protein